MLILYDRQIVRGKEAFATLAPAEPFTENAVPPGLLAKADALVVRSTTRVTPELLRGTAVRFVGSVTSGVDHVDTAYCAANGIRFAPAPGCNAESVACYVIAALLRMHCTGRINLPGMSLGIIGRGQVGRRVASLAQAAGMRVIANDPPLRRAGETDLFSLEKALSCDVVTLHVPLISQGGDATVNLLNDDRLARMHRGAWLINTSRPEVIHHQTLVSALEKKKLRGAILDVWCGEPAIDTNLAAAASIATPHIAGFSIDGRVRGTAMVFQALQEHFCLPATGWNPDRGEQVVEADNLPDLMQTVASVVRKVYAIEADDSALRCTLTLGQNDRINAFKRLRREYPVRRDFSNVRVRGIGADTPAGAMLHRLGFRIVPS